jgi:exodeoxyribonuclease-1
MADGRIAERAGLDGERCRQHLALIRDHLARHPGVLVEKLRQLYTGRAFVGSDDPETQLYDGFIPDEDRQLLAELHELSPEELAVTPAPFSDGRLPELLFRYRARNYPETLDPEERERWDLFRFQRITESDDPRRLDLEHFHADIEARLSAPDLSERDRQVLMALQDWGDALLV